MNEFTGRVLDYEIKIKTAYPATGRCIIDRFEDVKHNTLDPTAGEGVFPNGAEIVYFRGLKKDGTLLPQIRMNVLHVTFGNFFDTRYYTQSIQPPLDIETPNSGHQLFGVEPRDDRGFMVGLFNDHRVASRFSNLEAFYGLLVRLDGEYQLSELYDDGRLVATEEEYRDLKNLFKALSPSEKNIAHKDDML